MRPALLVIALALALVSLAGFREVLAKDNPVAVGNLFFCDSSKSGQVCETPVTAGDTVTWTVQSGSHTVTQCTDSTFTSCGSGFASSTLNSGQTFTQSFAQTGTFFYNCAFHPTEMRGRIVAAQAATASPTPAPSGTAAASPTAAPSLPQTGGSPDGGAGMNGILFIAGAALLLAGVGGLAFARRRAD